MSIKTRKGIRPGFLAAALGVVAMLAVAATLTLSSGPAHAQTSPFDPNAPTAVNAVEHSTTQVNVTWTAGTGTGAPTTGYEVERKEGSGAYMSVAPAHTGVMASYADSSVSAGMTYTYRVRATNAFGSSDWVESNEVTAMRPRHVAATATATAATVSKTPAPAACTTPATKSEQRRAAAALPEIQLIIAISGRNDVPVGAVPSCCTWRTTTQEPAFISASELVYIRGQR